MEVSVTQAFVAFAAAAVPLALLVTKGVDFIRNLIDADQSMPSWAWNVAAFVLGVGLCLGWEFNPVASMAMAVPALADGSGLDGFAGQLLSGLAIGAMAGLWHDRLASWRTPTLIVDDTTTTS